MKYVVLILLTVVSAVSQGAVPDVVCKATKAQKKQSAIARVEISRHTQPGPPPTHFVRLVTDAKVTLVGGATLNFTDLGLHLRVGVTPAADDGYTSAILKDGTLEQPLDDTDHAFQLVFETNDLATGPELADLIIFQDKKEYTLSGILCGSK